MVYFGYIKSRLQINVGEWDTITILISKPVLRHAQFLSKQSIISWINGLFYSAETFTNINLDIELKI